MKHSLIALFTLAALTACNPSQQQGNQAASQANSASAASQAQGGAADKDDKAPLKAHDIQGEKVTVKTARGDTVVPKNPQNVAVYDLGALDTLTALGVPVGATVDKSMLPYLKGAFDKAQHVGTLFEPNYEALGAFKPQLIIIGSRATVERVGTHHRYDRRHQKPAHQRRRAHRCLCANFRQTSRGG